MSLPSVTLAMGIIPGNLLIIFGAILCMYSGMLLISCAVKTNSDRYEDFAKAAYGERASKITSWCVILCLLGVVISYITMIKRLIPQILLIIAGFNYSDDMPEEDKPFIIKKWG